MKIYKTFGIFLIALSVIFFGIFIWWGTTIYKPEFAIGIIIVAIGTFIAGMISFLTDKNTIR